MRKTLACRLLLPLLLTACGTREPPASPPADPEPPPAAAPDSGPNLDTLRSALDGDPLADDEVRFLHRALKKSGTEYTEDGLLTFVEWDLRAKVTTSEDGRWRLWVRGDKVNADWELAVDPHTGAMEEVWVATEIEPPSP